MSQYMKIMIKQYIDMLDDEDLRFMRQVHTIIKRYLEKTGRL